MKGVKAINSRIILNGLARTILYTEQIRTDLEVNRSTYSVEVFSVTDTKTCCVILVRRSLFQTNS